MNADQLLAHYEKIADTPEAIPRLRRFILDLAVRGKLVPQDPNDEPASELLKRIMAEKARLVEAGEIKKPRALPKATDGEVPYPLPNSWAWVRVGDIFIYDAGTKCDPQWLDADRWLLELEDIEKDTSVVISRFKVSDRNPRSTKSEFQIGDILYGKLRPYLNKVIVADEAGYSTTEIVAIRSFLPLFPNYCALAFRRPDFVEYVGRLGQGTKMPRLRTEDAISAVFPLPPLAEQHRIVAKVDELMALCDRLEVARRGRETARNRLTTASLARLNRSDPDEQAFRDHAGFVLDNLTAITTRSDQIKQIRQTILNLAVRGKLVSQDPNDEPASELLKRIAAAKERIGGKERAKNNRRTENSFDSGEIALPVGWEAAPFADLVTVLNGRAYKKTELLETGTPVLRVGNLFTSDKWYYSNLELDDDKYCDEGDLIFAWSASFGPFIWPGPRVIYHYHIWKLPLHSEDNLDKLYLYNFLLQKTREIKDAGHGVSMIHMTKEKMERLFVPLPPLAEQHRIVAKVDELMALCDRLEASLDASAATRRRLLDALLHAALSPETREREAA